MIFHEQCFKCPCKSLIATDCRPYIEKVLSTTLLRSVVLACGAIYRKGPQIGPEVIPGPNCPFDRNSL